MAEINTAPTFDQACEIIKNCNEESLKDFLKNTITIEMDRMLTFNQACAILHCSEQDLKSLIENGTIKPFVTDGYYLISKWALELFREKVDTIIKALDLYPGKGDNDE